MVIFPELSALEISFVHLLGVTGAGLILQRVVDRENNTHRAVLFAVAWFFGLRYAFWRATATLAPMGFTISYVASISLFALEMIAMVSSLSAFVMMSRFKLRSKEADQFAGWWRRNNGKDPKVAVMIATYNEELEVLERTIIGAKSLRHVNKQVIILDDGKRDWLRDYCQSQGVRYMRRPDNKGAKAGNINHALGVLAQDTVPPDYVAVLDADFVPHRGFISRTLALFHDPDVGLVQTPQHFFNPDPIQHNLGLSRSYPDEQRFFFDHMQPSRDGWGIAFCCGTSSMIRFKALQEIGGFPTSSITEDFLLTLVLKTSGWRTVYLSEPLTEGLAPEGLKEYITQRARWCLGQMQIGRGEMGPFSRNKLTLIDRWGVADACLYWLASFVFRIAVLLFPLLYWYGNITVVNATLPDAVDYFGCYYLWVLFTLNHLSRGMMVPILHDVSQLLGAIPIARNAIIGIIRPTGHKFTVTAKGGDRSKVVVQWQLMRPFLILFSLTLIGLLIGIVSPRFSYNDAGDGKWVVLYWTIYNLAVLAVTLIACIELPRQEEHVGDEPERAIAALDGRARRVWLTGLTQDRATIRGHIYEVEDRGAIRIRDVGDVECYVIAKTPDGARIHLLPTPDQREELFLKFYADGETASISRVRGFAIMRDLLGRFGPGPERG